MRAWRRMAVLLGLCLAVIALRPLPAHSGTMSVEDKDVEVVDYNGRPIIAMGRPASLPGRKA